MLGLLNQKNCDQYIRSDRGDHIDYCLKSGKADSNASAEILYLREAAGSED